VAGLEGCFFSSSQGAVGILRELLSLVNVAVVSYLFSRHHLSGCQDCVVYLFFFSFLTPGHIRPQERVSVTETLAPPLWEALKESSVGTSPIVVFFYFFFFFFFPSASISVR